MYSGDARHDGCQMWITDTRRGQVGMGLRVARVLATAISPFQKIEVVETPEFGRTMLINGNVSMTERDEKAYSEILVHPGLLSHPGPKKALIVGGGDGSVLSQTVQHAGLEEITVVEIDEMIIKVARDYFPALAKSFDDGRVKIVINDGQPFLRETAEKFDAIFVDSYDPIGPGQTLFGAPFLECAKDRLAKNGILVTEAGSPVFEPERARKSLLNLRALFTHACPLVSYTRSLPGGVSGFVYASGETAPKMHVEGGAVEELRTAYYNEAIHSACFALSNEQRQVFDV